MVLTSSVLNCVEIRFQLSRLKSEYLALNWHSYHIVHQIEDILITMILIIQSLIIDLQHA